MIKQLLIAMLFITTALQAQTKENNKFKTYFEAHEYNQTPRYPQTIEYCKLLADNSPWITYTSIGKSPQGRDIPLLIVDKDGDTSVTQCRAKGKAIVLIEACIHAGEPDGKEAGFMLIRDIAIYKKNTHLLDNVTLLFIPIINVDGHEQFSAYNRINQNGPLELGTRTTAQRINMNRDFIKADAPEMQHWIKLYTTWMPELFIDVHVTNGADFQYVITYGMDNTGYMENGLRQWAQNNFEKPLKEMMKNNGFPIFPYFSFIQQNKPEKGMTLDTFAPQYSNGYAAAHNRIGLLIETHIYKPYKQRVEGTYKMLSNAIEIVNTKRDELQSAIAKADKFTSSDAFRKEPLVLTYTNTFTDSIPDNFLGWKTKTITSDLSGAKWTLQDYDSPITTPTHIYTSFKPEKTATVPKAYILTPENISAIELLKLHGLNMEILTEPIQIKVQTYRFISKKEKGLDPIWAQTPYEGRITTNVTFTTQNEVITYPKGAVIVKMDQPKAKIAAFLLEPDSPTSLVYWGFYNSYINPPSEFWVRVGYMEVKGREMMAKDPKLKEEFQQKIANDSSFANNPQARLQFFYDKLRQHVEPYGNLYPIGKIIDTL